MSRMLRLSLRARRFLAKARKAGFRSSAQRPMFLGLRPCGELGTPSVPINADRCLLKQTSMVSLGAGIPAPIARYHTIVKCKGNHIKPPTTRSPTQRFPSAKNLIKFQTIVLIKIPTYWKIVLYPQMRKSLVKYQNIVKRKIHQKYHTVEKWSRTPMLTNCSSI